MLKSITVRHLRELLESEDDDALVIFSTGYGDRGNTPQALPIRGESGAGRGSWSRRSRAAGEATMGSGLVRNQPLCLREQGGMSHA